MTIVFVSNYINHHQLPFCKEMIEQNAGNFWFIQTERMDPERVQMGWGVEEKEYDFVRCFYEEEAECRRLILESEVVIFGGCEDESLIEPRLKRNRLTLRYSERIYKEGQWKFISPRGLRKKYRDHVQYRNKKVYLLCAGGYVASDFHLIHAYPNKMFTWGYFPEFLEYDPYQVMEEKRRRREADGRMQLLWSGRMIDWKHPEQAIHLAAELKAKQRKFHLTMIGDGDLRAALEQEVSRSGLEDLVTFTGFLKPAEVRNKMLSSDIYLFTSDFKEGWGAVLNEAMNSCCSVVASSGIGAVPFLLRHESNGMVYRCNDEKEMIQYADRLCTDDILRERTALNAYETIRGRWNAKNAAGSLLRFLRSISLENPEAAVDGPMSRAPIIAPKKGYEYTRI